MEFSNHWPMLPVLTQLFERVLIVDGEVGRVLGEEKGDHSGTLCVLGWSWLKGQGCMGEEGMSLLGSS